MEYFVKLAVFLLLVACASAGQYYSYLKNGKKASVEHIVSPNERAERSPKRPEEIFKEQMEFTVTLSTGEVIDLHLKLNKNQIGKVLVKVISESGTEFFDNTKPRDYRYYQMIGDSHGASVMVRCENYKPPCYIAGSFYYNSDEYVIDPDTEIAQKVSMNPYTVYKVKTGNITHAFDHDTAKVVKGGSEAEKRRRLSNVILDLLKHHKSRKTKRQVSKKHYKIELEMVVDDSIYTFWLSRMANNPDAAIEEIEKYMGQVANNMDLRYSTATITTMEIDIVPLIITIIKDKSKNSWITNNIVNVDSTGDESYNGSKALDELEIWAGENKSPQADAVACFSRRDMWTYDGQREFKSTVGLARVLLVDANLVSALCSSSAVSLNEDLRSGDTSATVAHELGHNHGLEHDVDMGCSDDDLFIMAGSLGFVSAASQAKNPWSFSSCAVNRMKDLMLSVPTNAEGKSCLERHTYDVTEYNTIRTSDLLGELYSTDTQCELLVGTGSTHCRGTSIKDDEICWKGLPCSTSGFSCNVIYPLSGSSCGGTKKCYQGQCVDALPEIVTEAVPTQSSESSSSSTTSSTTTLSTTTQSPTTSSTTQSPTTSSATQSTTTTSTTTTQSPTTSSTTTTQSPTTSSTTTTQSSKTTSTLAETSSTTTSSSSTASSTSTTHETTTSFEDVYTQDEYWLFYFYYRCGSRCRCWRRQCRRFKQKPLCKRFAYDCYN